MVLFELPTPRELAGRLDSRHADGLLEVLLPIRAEGGLPPLFCFHPAIGISWRYGALLRGLTDRPLYGVQLSGLTRECRLPATAEEMIDEYLSYIRAVQPHGPYHLVGWSLGGTIAHGLAIRLQELNERVELLALLDAYPLDIIPPRNHHALRADMLQNVNENEALRAHAHTAIESISNMFRILEDRHTFGTFHGDALLFVASQRAEAKIEHPASAWPRYIDGTIDVHDIDCDHEGIGDYVTMTKISETIAFYLNR